MPQRQHPGPAGGSTGALGHAGEPGHLIRPGRQLERANIDGVLFRGHQRHFQDGRCALSDVRPGTPTLDGFPDRPAALALLAYLDKIDSARSRSPAVRHPGLYQHDGAKLRDARLRHPDQAGTLGPGDSFNVSS